MSGFVNNFLLLPYSTTLRLRSFLYNKGILKSKQFSTPVISIGNITAGGTGKTPHVEMLLSLLSARDLPVGDDGVPAVVSLGYGRKDREVRYVSIADEASLVGDEPLQIKRKFPDATVAVGRRRDTIIEDLEMNAEPPVKCFIMDDGFQFRRVKPSCNIVLVDFNRPIFKDSLLPLGGLRDLPSQIKRADMVIVSKVPELLDPEEMDQWRKNLKLKAEQPLYFTRIVYGAPTPIFSTMADNRYVYSKEVVLFTGIADDYDMEMHVSLDYRIVAHVRFKDHHNYSQKDIEKLSRLAARNRRAALVTTEKDAMRFLSNPYITDDLCSRLFYLPMKVEFLHDTMREDFLSRII